MVLAKRVLKGLAVATALAVMAPAVTASAADRIGVASAIQRDVTGTLDGSVRDLNSGVGVFRDERITTRTDSAAQLLFLDETSLAIGPSSEVVLDRFVYNPSGTAKEISVEAVKGAFRFVSGSSEPRSYAIKTPLATIGVRGTIIDILVESSRVIVILVEGAFDMCVGGNCTGVVKPGHFVVVNAGGRIQGPRQWDNSVRNVLGKVSFPLFGNHLDADRTRPYGMTDNRSRVDQIEQRYQYQYYYRYYDDYYGEPGIGGAGRRRGGR